MEYLLLRKAARVFFDLPDFVELACAVEEVALFLMALFPAVLGCVGAGSADEAKAGAIAIEHTRIVVLAAPNALFSHELERTIRKSLRPQKPAIPRQFCERRVDLPAKNKPNGTGTEMIPELGDPCQ